MQFRGPKPALLPLSTSRLKTARFGAIHVRHRVVVTNPKTLIRVTTVPREAPRESPVSIALFHGPWHDSDIYEKSGYVDHLVKQGFNVAQINLPGAVLGQESLDKSNNMLDEVVADVKENLLRHGIGTPPLAIAHSHAAVFLQKYLEDYPLAGLIMLAPLPPSCGHATRRWMGTWGNKRGLACALSAVSSHVVDGMPLHPAHRNPGEASPGCTTGSASPAATGACGSISTAPAATACTSGSDSTGYTLLGASAALIAKLAASPVNLEPQPVPMLVLSATDDCLLTPADIAATAEFHELSDDQVIALSLPTDYKRQLGHGMGLGDAELSKHVLQVIDEWIAPRF